ncbi:hypothetical protein MMC22_008880 [Lobaria immixta]|nr:hypothetical protein [Lobaria immixta]
MATTLEAMTHLRQSNSTENIEQAQRALAVARSQQLDPAVSALPQLATLVQCVDLCSTLQKLDPPQAELKMRTLQTMLDTLPEGHSLTEEGSFAISIAHARFSATKPSMGVVRSMPDGSTELVFNWLPRDDIYALGCLLSGIAITHRNTTDGQKAERMLKEGLRSQDETINKTNAIPHSIELAASRNVWRQVLKCHIQLQLTFALCVRTVWQEAQDQLRQLQETTANLPPEIADTLNLEILYLSGVISQGTGDLATALSIFQSSSFALPSESYSPLSPLHLDLAILAALNTLLIIRTPTHPSNELLPSLLKSLNPLCSTNPNRALLAAYHLLVATCSPSTTILLTKQHLQYALQAAKHSASNQLMCLTLNFMSWKFFKGVVGEQAEKSARASQALARKGSDRLWESVANGVLADTLDVAARYSEANEVRLKGQEIAAGLPDVMRDHGNADGDVCRGEPGVGMYGYYGGPQ